VAPQLQAVVRPRLEVVAGRDGAADALLGADGPELVKGGGALDGRLVDALLGHDLVCAAVAGHVLLHLGLRVVRRLVVAVGLDDVVLDQRVRRPAVYGQVAVPHGLEVARVDYLPGGWIILVSSMEYGSRMMENGGLS